MDTTISGRHPQINMDEQKSAMFYRSLTVSNRQTTFAVCPLTDRE
jgi:hypothetical protein